MVANEHIDLGKLIHMFQYYPSKQKLNEVLGIKNFLSHIVNDYKLDKHLPLAEVHPSTHVMANDIQVAMPDLLRRDDIRERPERPQPSQMNEHLYELQMNRRDPKIARQENLMRLSEEYRNYANPIAPNQRQHYTRKNKMNYTPILKEFNNTLPQAKSLRKNKPPNVVRSNASLQYGTILTREAIKKAEKIAAESNLVKAERGIDFWNTPGISIANNDYDFIKNKRASNVRLIDRNAYTTNNPFEVDTPTETENDDYFILPKRTQLVNNDT